MITLESILVNQVATSATDVRDAIFGQREWVSVMHRRGGFICMFSHTVQMLQ